MANGGNQPNPPFIEKMAKRLSAIPGTPIRNAKHGGNFLGIFRNNFGDFSGLIINKNQGLIQLN